MDFAPPPSDWIDAVVLGPGTAKRYAIPAGTHTVLLSATGFFWAKFGDVAVAAAIPGPDILTGAAAEFQPAARRVPTGVTHVSLIAPATCTISIACYGA